MFTKQQKTWQTNRGQVTVTNILGNNRGSASHVLCILITVKIVKQGKWIFMSPFMYSALVLCLPA
jgi:hypothetical protein